MMTPEEILNIIWAPGPEVLTIEEDIIVEDDWGLSPGVYICGNGGFTLIGDLDGNPRGEGA